jgi:hypothetical protein
MNMWCTAHSAHTHFLSLTFTFPLQPLCLDLFSSSGNLGRLCFADLGRTVAVGVVREVTWDASTSVIPCHVARPDRRRVLEQRRQARRARWRARQTEWVTGLRNLPVGALKVTGTALSVLS